MAPIGCSMSAWCTRSAEPARRPWPANSRAVVPDRLTGGTSRRYSSFRHLPHTVEEESQLGFPVPGVPSAVVAVSSGRRRPSRKSMPGPGGRGVWLLSWLASRLGRDSCYAPLVRQSYES